MGNCTAHLLVFKSCAYHVARLSYVGKWGQGHAWSWHGTAPRTRPTFGPRCAVRHRATMRPGCPLGFPGIPNIIPWVLRRDFPREWVLWWPNRPKVPQKQHPPWYIGPDWVMVRGVIAPVEHGSGVFAQV